MSKREVNIVPSEDLNINALALSERRMSNEVDVYSVLSVFWRHRWLMMAGVIAITSLGMMYTLTRPHVYESSAKILVVTSRKAPPGSDADIPIMTDLQSLKGERSIETQADIISSPDLVERAYNTIEPSLRRRGFASENAPSWAYSVNAKKSTDILLVTGRAYSPKAAAALANALVSTYFMQDLTQNNKATHQAREYAERETEKAAKELALANSELASYKRVSGMYAPDTQLEKTAEHMAKLSLDLNEARTEVASTRRELSAIKRQMAKEQRNVITGTTVTRNPRFTAILDKIDSLNSQRSSLLQEFTPTSKEVKAVEEQIKEEKKQLKQIAESIITSQQSSRNPIRDNLIDRYTTTAAASASAAARLHALEKEIGKQNKAARLLPERERKLSERMQRIAVLQRRYDLLSNNYYTLLLSERAMIPNGMLISKARPASLPAYPNTKLNLILFGFLGLLSAAISAVIAEHYDTKLHDQESAEQIVNVPTLTIVPDMAKDSPRLTDSGNQKLVLLESFRILRNNLFLANQDEPKKIIAVTSPGRHDGKSTTAVNLAIAVAMDGKRVVLVDADMRRPIIHRILDVPTEIGLSTVIDGKSSLEASVVQTSIRNFYCLTSGGPCPTPTETLNSPQCREIFRELAQKYDCVLVDCPPTTGLSDVQVISTFADTVLLVVAINKTLKPQLDIAVRMLDQAGANLAGLVVNRINASSRDYGYYYYYASDYAADESNKRRK